MKREGELKAAWAREMRQQLPQFYIFQIMTAGWPDRGVVGNSRTTFWEFKHATPDFDSPGNQQLFCRRLAAHAYCRYVVWWESVHGLGHRTMIVHPRHVHDGSLLPESSTTGFDHRWLVEKMREAHRL